MRELSCKQIVDLVTEYVEGALADADRTAFERHLTDCDGCLAYLDQMRDTIRLTGRLHEGSLPPEVREELLAAFRGWSGR